MRIGCIIVANQAFLCSVKDDGALRVRAFTEFLVKYLSLGDDEWEPNLFRFGDILLADVSALNACRGHVLSVVFSEPEKVRPPITFKVPTILP